MNTSDQWLRQARYDLDTAFAMLNSGRYLYVLFCCQQAIEKMLKARFAARVNACPPRIHSLTRLAAAIPVDLTEERAQFLRELSHYYIQTRYPEEISELAVQLSEEQARGVYEQTKEIMQWLASIE